MNKKLIFILSLLILSSVITTSVWAAATNTCYTFETGVPFIAGKGECKAPSGLTNMIISLIPILFRVAGVLAFVMIVYAGFQYATSGGDTSKQKDAQDRIINAIIGLVLLFAFYLIIYTINPDILKIQELSLESVNMNTTTTAQEAPLYLQNFIQIAKSYAATTKIAYSKTTDPTYKEYAIYLKALKETCGDPLPNAAFKGASCDIYIAAVVNHSMMGPLLNPDYKFPCFSVDEQWYYITNTAKDKFECAIFTSLDQVKPGSILFFDTNNNKSPDHTALKLDDGVYQASNADYYPYGPGSSYTAGTACYWKGFYRGY